MMRLLKDVLKPIYLFITQKKWRAYYKLIHRHSKDKRFQRREARFLGYKMTIVDSLSFIHQFKEIFLDETYKFVAENENPLIIDGGANVGLSCLYFKNLFPHCTIKAFEADPDIFEVLKANISQNIQGNGIQLFPTAIWKNNNGIEFMQEGADGGSILSTGPKGKISVHTIRLNDLLMEGKVDLLKLDIEGAEADVLLDCSEGLRNVQTLFFEYHSFWQQPQRFGQLLQFLSDNHFRYFIQSPGHVPAPFVQTGVHKEMDLQLNVYCYRR